MTSFENHQRKTNSDNSDLLISGNKAEQVLAEIEVHKIWQTRTVNLLDIATNNNLKFDEHLSNICLEANRKLTFLTRVRKCLDIDKMNLE